MATGNNPTDRSGGSHTCGRLFLEELAQSLAPNAEHIPEESRNGQQTSPPRSTPASARFAMPCYAFVVSSMTLHGHTCTTASHVTTLRLLEQVQVSSPQDEHAPSQQGAVHRRNPGDLHCQLRRAPGHRPMRRARLTRRERRAAAGLRHGQCLARPPESRDGGSPERANVSSRGVPPQRGPGVPVRAANARSRCVSLP